MLEQLKTQLVQNMYDIVCFKTKAAAEELGFKRYYFYDEIVKKVKNVKNLEEAANYRNRMVLLMLDDYSLEEGALKLIGEKGEACFVINLSRLIKGRGIRRALELGRLRNFLKYCVRYNVRYALASFADDEQSLRTAQELMHIGLLVGLDLGKTKNALSLLNLYLV